MVRIVRRGKQIQKAELGQRRRFTVRQVVSRIADIESWSTPATIEDPVVLDEIGGALRPKGVRA